MTGPVNNINETAYTEVGKKEKVYASADNDPQDQKITAKEAQNYSGSASVFTDAKTKGEQQIDEEIKNSTRLSPENQANAKSVVQKYLGGVSFTSLLNNWSKFGEITYTAVEINDADFKADVQNQIDNQINAKITDKVNTLSQEITAQYKAKLKNALTQAENELVGDKDLGGTGSVSTKSDHYAMMKEISYHRPGNDDDGMHTEVSTFNSSIKGAEASQGYTNTVAYLEANGAKAKIKLVNGQEQTVYKIKDDKGTRYVTVDDAGQVHDLDKNKGFLRSSKFTTRDSIEDAKAQTGLDKAVDVKVKVRNVDGQKQSVMTWRDDDGNKYSRVIDHNEQTGITTSTIVHKVNAGGRAKYSSDVSGLGALASKDPNDDIQFNDEKHRFQNGTWTDETGETHANNVITQHGRMKLDKANTGEAIKNIVAEVKSKGIEVPEAKDGVTTITINGHEYKLDKNDNVSANRTMRLIKGELARLNRPGSDSSPQSEEVTLKIDEDGRDDTNNADFHKREHWRNSEGNVEGVGVVSPQEHTPSTAGQGKINSVRYGNNISRAQFAREGWTASAGRTEEEAILKQMDAEKGVNEKHTRNLKNATEFAERFVKAMKTLHKDELGNNEYNTELLGKAIADANPSFFDSDGNMYKNADFSRLNLPKKLDRYKKS